MNKIYMPFKMVLHCDKLIFASKIPYSQKYNRVMETNIHKNSQKAFNISFRWMTVTFKYVNYPQPHLNIMNPQKQR